MPTSLTDLTALLRCPAHPTDSPLPRLLPLPDRWLCPRCGEGYTSADGVLTLLPPDPPDAVASAAEAEQWDEQAAAYDAPREADDIYMAGVAAAADELTPQPGERVLDAGCGTGLTLRRYWKPGVRVVALDLSAESLRVAHGTGPTDGVLHVRGDLTRLPFADGAFDRVCCANAVQQLPTPELRRRVMQELARVTRPGGKAVVTVHNFSVNKRRGGWRKEATDTGSHTGAVRYVYRYDADEFRSLLGRELAVVRVGGAGLPLPYKWKLGPLMRVVERVVRPTALGRAFGHMLVGVGRK